MQINQIIQQKNREPCIITIGSKKTTILTFESILIQAVDTAFSTLNNKQNIYRQLETKYDICLLDIADNPAAFAAALKDMFGEASTLIELKIISLLHNKAPQIKYHLLKNEEFSFCSYLQNFKNSFTKI